MTSKLVLLAASAVGMAAVSGPATARPGSALRPHFSPAVVPNHQDLNQNDNDQGLDVNDNDQGLDANDDDQGLDADNDDQGQDADLDDQGEDEPDNL